MTFTEEGGMVGRSPDKNRFILPDPNNTVSRHHGVIHYNNGVYTYTDISSIGVGTLLNSSKWLDQGHEVEVKAGDILRLGAYELCVSFEENNDSVSTKDAYDWDIPSDPNIWDTPKLIGLDDIFGTGPQEIPAGSKPGHGQAPSDVWEPLFPESSPVGSALGQTNQHTPTVPQNEPWHPDKGPALQPQSARHSAHVKIPHGADLLRILLEGAGLDDNAEIADLDQAEVMRRVGQLLRALVEGMTSLLSARDAIKREYRLSRTTMGKLDNNLLKTSIPLNDTLISLLSGSQPGYKDPLTSVRESLGDLERHQIAMEAGIQAGLAAAVKRFDPALIEALSDEGIVFQKKAKCWENYVAAYPGLVEEIEEIVFGQKFAEGYEEQIKQLLTRQL